MKKVFAWIVLLSCTAGSASAATIVPDQSTIPYINSAYTNGYFVGLTYDMYQTFTVGVSGQLASVGIAVTERENTATDLVLSIWTTGPDSLRETMLYSMVTPAASFVPPALGGYEWLEFDVLSAGINVNNGDVLAINLQAVGASLQGLDGYYWQTTDIPRQIPANNYTGGESFLCYNNNPLYCEQRLHDYIFTTSVQLVPVPAAVWLFGSALLGLAWKRRQL